MVIVCLVLSRNLGTVLDPLGAVQGHLSVILGFWRPVGATSGYFEFWLELRPSCATLAAYWDRVILGDLGAILAPSWAFLAAA